jgi:nitrogen regulatory protein PII
MLTRVLHELRETQLHGLTVSDVRGFGREKDESYPHHASDYAIDFTPKIKLEILCRDSEVFVSDVESVVSIRSSQAGDEAI